MLPQYFVFISVGLIGFAGYFYIKDMLKGETKPNRASWLVWFLAPVLAAIMEFSHGAGLSALPVFLSGMVPLAVLIVSYTNKNAYWELSWLDYVCLALSLLALVFWLVFNQGILATVLAIAADGLAFIPTYIKSWRAPETETLSAYLMGGFNGLLGVATLPSITFLTAGFAAYLFLGNMLEIGILVARRSVK